MTREEAIEVMKAYRDKVINSVSNQLDGDIKAFNMAIQALSQEPCDDAISREDRLIDLANAIESDDSGYWTNKRISSALRNIPSVTQKSGNWIEDAKTYYEELNKRGLGVDEYTPYFTDDIACSECLAKYNTIDNETEFFKYCPNCGARMESEE